MLRNEILPAPELIRAPALPPSPASEQAGDLAEAPRKRLQGEVRFDAGARALYATDLSIYRQPPIGVVIPRSIEDVLIAVEECRRHAVPILGRGCGTSLAGQTRNVAVVIDFSKLAGVNMRLEAGGIRELHWHKVAEWSIMLYGAARITAIDADGRSFVRDVFEGDLWYFPTGIPHSIQGLSPDGAEFLLVFDDGHFSEHETVLLSDVMAHTPRETVTQNFGMGEKELEGIPREDLFIFQAPVPGPLALDQEAAAGKWVRHPRISRSGPRSWSL